MNNDMPHHKIEKIGFISLLKIVANFKIMWFAKIITAGLFFLSSLSLASQRVIFKTYTVYDGLVANPVRCIYQDSKGFIWIGTYEGLSRYDGYKFTNYTTANGLSHNFINAMIGIRSPRERCMWAVVC